MTESAMLRLGQLSLPGACTTTGAAPAGIGVSFTRAVAEGTALAETRASWPRLAARTTDCIVGSEMEIEKKFLRMGRIGVTNSQLLKSGSLSQPAALRFSHVGCWVWKMEKESCSVCRRRHSV